MSLSNYFKHIMPNPCRAFICSALTLWGLPLSKKTNETQLKRQEEGGEINNFNLGQISPISRISPDNNKDIKGFEYENYNPFKTKLKSV